MVIEEEDKLISEFENFVYAYYNPIDNQDVKCGIDNLRQNLTEALKDDHILDLNSLRITSLLQNYSFDILSQFYRELMVPNFPLKEELDSLEDWIYCLDPSSISKWEYINDGPIMDVILLVCQSTNHGTPTILAGVAFEYYRQAEVGLVSYVTTNCNYQCLGIMKILHPLAVNALNLLHLYSYKKYKGKNAMHTIRAILAETNTIDAGDATPIEIQTRHKKLYKLGYRKLICPYIQPPLASDADWFYDTMLLIYQPGLSSLGHTCSSSIVLDFVFDFAKSVYGYNEEDVSYMENQYFQLLVWFSKHHNIIHIQPNLPWLDDKPNLIEEYRECTAQKPLVVVVIGAGISGLCTAVELAENAMFPIRVVLLEANEYVGGRIRTIFTDREKQYVSKSVCDSYNAFAPWPVPLGGEFIHGENSVLSEVVEKNDWVTEETFNFASLSEPPCSSSFISRATMTPLGNKHDHVKIFIDQRLWGLTSCSTSEERIAVLYRKALHIWDRVCEYGGEASDATKKNGSVIDMSILDFIHKEMEFDDKSDLEIVVGIVDAMFARTAGSNITSFGLLEAGREENDWDYSECNFRSAGCFGDLIKCHLDKISKINERFHANHGHAQILLRTSSPVTRVGSRDRKPFVAVTSTDGEEELLFDKLVVTIPLACLKLEKIFFEKEYEFSTEKKLAIKKINMFSGMKAHILFMKNVDVEPKSIFDDTELFFCPGEIFSQVWVRRDDTSVFVTGFVVSTDRDVIVNCLRNGHDAKEMMMNQLLRMAKIAFLDTNNPTCSAFSLYDWSKDDYVLGLYSSPSVGCYEYRKHLRAPIKETIFFAGEHTNEKSCATVQAAMESGIKAAGDVLHSFKFEKVQIVKKNYNLNPKQSI